MHRFASYLVTTFGLVLGVASAEQIFEGYTVVSGRGYAFELKAPRGWYLDNEVGRGQGLSVVFYPRGYSWDNAPAVCYVEVRTLGGKVSRVEDQIEDTLRNLHEHGVTNAQARFVRTITTQDASKARVYYFTADRAGNEEATAYIQAKTSIHFITLSAQGDDAFRNALPAFESMVSSYEDLTKPPYPADAR